MNYHASRLSPRAKRRRWPARYRHPQLYPVKVHGEIGWTRFEGPVRRSWKRRTYHIWAGHTVPPGPVHNGVKMRDTVGCGQQPASNIRVWLQRKPSTQCPKCLKAWREQTKVTP